VLTNHVMGIYLLNSNFRHSEAVGEGERAVSAGTFSLWDMSYIRVDDSFSSLFGLKVRGRWEI
jgi:hypothetical protein